MKFHGSLTVLTLRLVCFIRWMKTSIFGRNLECGSNEVAVGACSGGGQWGSKHCPESTVHQLKCCVVPQYSYSNCITKSSDYGIPIDCRYHGQKVAKGQCHSGEYKDCSGGVVNKVVCCDGHYKNVTVRPSSKCYWQYGRHGVMKECAGSDVLVGRCGSGGALDCPHVSSHGIKCCKLEFTN